MELAFAVVAGAFFGGASLAFALYLICMAVDRDLADRVDKLFYKLMIPCGIIMGVVIYLVRK